MKIIYAIILVPIILLIVISAGRRMNINKTSLSDSSKVKVVKQNKRIGIGPVKKLKLWPVDQKLAEDGKNIFNDKCTACHNLDVEIQAPALRSVTKELRPEYIMNYLLNTEEMQKKDPQIKELIKKYNGEAMPDPQLKEPQARALLEYFRSVSK